jgi:hypothetical protein
MQTSISRDLPHRGEVLAAAAVLIVLAHALFAQLTGLIAVACHLTGRTTRWRLSWLATPAAAGLAWTLAVGTRPAVAGLLAGPDHVLSCITTRASAPGHPLRLPDVYAGATSWLPRQFPLALVLGPAEAALGSLRPAFETRPGLLATLRRRLNLRRMRAGKLRVRDGAVLGVDPATGAPAALTWASLTGGALVTGSPAREVTETALRVVRAALRRRKPVIVIDLDPTSGAASWLGSECRRYECPVITDAVTTETLLTAVRGRAAALITASGDQRAATAACEAVLGLCGELRRIGVDGDGLVWLRGCSGPSAELVGALIAEGASAGLPVVVSALAADFPAGVVVRHGLPGELRIGSRRAVTP